MLNTLSIALLFLIDFLLQSIFNLSNPQHIQFVSNLHFIALVVYAREDDRTDIAIKVLLVSFFMDLIHLGSFPAYYLAYGISILVIRFWHRHVSDSYFEKMLIIGLALFIKEIVMFFALFVMGHVDVSITWFIANRSLWVILFNIVVFPIAYVIINKTNKLIKNYSKRHYQ
ncbi:MAG: hypothetical protein GX038_06230 [Erysipelothrix sp.]|nr:hypothetical protein [Erysipelothrix sp.]